MDRSHGPRTVPGDSGAVLVVTFGPVASGDAEDLVALRILAMRESLERVGRFDPTRARERFLSGFLPERTRHVLVAGVRVGFVVLRATDDGLWLDHFYVHPAHQRRGIGGAVLARLFAEADAQALALRCGALKGSDSNRFYVRNGFALVAEAEWDNYYVRPPGARPAAHR